MAAVEVKVGSAVVKLRRPWAVGALSLIPVYWVFWYYAVNREMRDFGRVRRDARLGESSTRPASSALVLSLLVGGSLAGWVGAFAGSGTIALLLTSAGIPASIAATVLMQRRLTRLWTAG
jgi:hypothetical protein